MQAWAQEFVEVWKKNNRFIAESVLRAINENPNISGKYRLEDMEQLFLGAVAMMEEELTGRGSEIRDTYINSAIPGILNQDQGETLSSLVHQVTFNCTLVYTLLIPMLSAEHREQAGKYLMWWYANLNRDIVKIGLEVGAKP
jgi:hypothetical protein